jgi:predicted transcriptional regulator
MINNVVNVGVRYCNAMEKGEKSESGVINVLKSSRDGLTITELVGLSKFSRSTVRVVLARLEGGNKVSIRRIGMAKVYALEGGR